MSDAALHLHNTYAAFADAWRAWMSNQTISDDSPAVQWRVDDDPADTPITAEEKLLQIIELVVSRTRLAVRDHLGALVNGYPTPAVREAVPEAFPWPGSSAFTQARSILEGAAIITWLVDATAHHNERMKRSARLVLWSAHHGARWAAATGGTSNHLGRPESYKPLIEDAGLTVTTDRHGQLIVDKAFRHTEVINASFGSHGKNLYNRWSGAAHHAPWMLNAGTYIRVAEGNQGVHIGTEARIADHLQIAADVADILLRCSAATRTYWGQTETSDHRERLTAAAHDLRAQAAQARSNQPQERR